MTRTTLRCRLLTVSLIAMLPLGALTGCSSSRGGQLAADRETTASCPAEGMNTHIGIDGSPSYRSADIRAKNLTALTPLVRKTALCHGHLRVFAFASSSGQTVTLFNGDLSVDAPTENAEIRKAGQLADDTIAHITADYDTTLDQLTGTGTDVVGMLDLLRDAAAQAPDAQLYALWLTDGLTNTSVDPTSTATPEAAAALADTVVVPDLTGASVHMVGVGQQAAGELPSGVIENVKAFWIRLLTRTGAGTVLVVTEGQ